MNIVVTFMALNEYLDEMHGAESINKGWRLLLSLKVLITSIRHVIIHAWSIYGSVERIHHA